MLGFVNTLLLTSKTLDLSMISSSSFHLHGHLSDMFLLKHIIISQKVSPKLLSDYFSELRTESMEERESVRAMVRNRISRDSVAKTMYEINRQPWELEELEEESSRKVEAGLSQEERIAELRRTTESMLTHRTEYIQSTRELALQAMRVSSEDILSCS